jgi:8-hydroxy-5-deazaflavin:NADPH oxidoreductase
MLGFIGGTGPEGLGLAMRYARAGESVFIGSRSKERGEEAATKIREAVGGTAASGADNLECARSCEVLFLTIPYEGQADTLAALEDALKGKLVVNVIAPMTFEKGIGAVGVIPSGGSAAEESAGLLPQSRVVSAFQNLSAKELQELEHPLEADILVCSDDDEARATVLDLVERVPNLRGVNAGPLRNSRYVEQITPLLVNLNRLHKTQTGIRITGI